MFLPRLRGSVSLCDANTRGVKLRALNFCSCWPSSMPSGFIMKLWSYSLTLAKWLQKGVVLVIIAGIPFDHNAAIVIG
jgi:hypothetical protein